ncbi:carboxymuconolactone decarboxylase family protein [Ponticaulis sp.]|uniref:carboxymuconolactone decarboxylase family protein n=1 Tax=Ponticaulis sp. TaxID=2020902 RepID=UPI00262292E6|nr:carboxymuconolactone decarboxylase family protein [Ponticaulis sp.]MDF1680501.1 carboxymuconolactone decarboxylase family protein [Ponticaulis sp.]
MSNILAPVSPPYSKPISERLGQYPKRDGYLLKLFRVFANSPRFLAKGVPNLLDRDSPLSMRCREIIILRVTGLMRCEYEWGVHITAFADHVGLSEEQRADTCEPAINPSLWSETECLLLRIVDQLIRHGGLEDVALQALRATWTLEQQLEICALIGTYHTVSNVANIAALSPETFSARFPSQI